VDPLKESPRLAAKVCMDNQKIVREIAATAEIWPEGTLQHCMVVRDQSAQMFGALVRLYLRTL
jgi:hypothetical protein